MVRLHTWPQPEPHPSYGGSEAGDSNNGRIEVPGSLDQNPPFGILRAPGHPRPKATPHESARLGSGDERGIHFHNCWI